MHQVQIEVIRSELSQRGIETLQKMRITAAKSVSPSDLRQAVSFHIRTISTLSPWKLFQSLDVMKRSLRGMPDCSIARPVASSSFERYKK